MLEVNTLDKVKTIVLFVCMLFSMALFAQSEKSPTKSKIVMTKSELNSFLSTVADARRSQLKERENNQNKSNLSELRSNYQQRYPAENYGQYNITNEQLLREIRYLNQRIDNLSPRDSRFPSMARDNSTIIMPGNAATSPMYNPNGNNATTVIPSNNSKIKDLQRKIDSLKAVENGRTSLSNNGSLADSLKNVNSRLNDVRRQMDSLESKMNSKIKSGSSDKNRTYFRQQVYFANNSESLEAEYLKYVQDLTQILIQYPEAKILLEGWASPVGSVNYNKQLSMRRAESVEKAFINNKIQASRILTSFKGEDRKSTAEQARRVEMSIIVR
ncbi:OmpA family protein [Flavobacterium micromati]|uniref:OmpA family protein n=1 Tax=Flavobacterium micromati TaxID=229205 RepID=A0A1M5GV90_9FLAO|nr:OmpA family protein [Flavobacterium micromati]SHG07676.1 OmpA family protein [Flavobacterium micromati]